MEFPVCLWNHAHFSSNRPSLRSMFNEAELLGNCNCTQLSLRHYNCIFDVEVIQSLASSDAWMHRLISLAPILHPQRKAPPVRKSGRIA